MLHLSTVESTTLELLKKLQQLSVLCNTRLVGGTALALQLGHRKSVDLDFFDDVVYKDGIRLASPRDIAAMKITAIEGRGTKKRFCRYLLFVEKVFIEKSIGFLFSKIS